MPVNGPQRGRRSQHSRRAGRPGASGGVRHPAAGIDNVELDYPASPGGKNASDHMESGFFNKYALDEAEGRKGVADPPDVKSGVSSGGSVKSRDRVEAAPDPENSEMTDGVTRGSHRYSNKSGARCQIFENYFIELNLLLRSSLWFVFASPNFRVNLIVDLIVLKVSWSVLRFT